MAYVARRLGLDVRAMPEPRWINGVAVWIGQERSGRRWGCSWREDYGCFMLANMRAPWLAFADPTFPPAHAFMRGVLVLCGGKGTQGIVEE